MARPPSPISLQLRKLLLNHISSSSSSASSSRTLQIKHFSSISSINPNFKPKFPTHFKSFSQITGDPDKISENPDQISENPDQIAHILSNHTNSSSISLTQTLDLNFSHITLTPPLILHVLKQSPLAGRSILDFLNWVLSKPNIEANDEVLSMFVDYFGRRKDFKAIHEVLVKHRGVAGAKTLLSYVDRLVRAGRAPQTVSMFDRMEEDYGFVRNLNSLRMIVSKLCDHGFASNAEKMVKNLANEFFPDETLCNLLVKGWCVDGKIEEARRLAGEMYRGGFALGALAYNAMLDCVCRICREKDPFRLRSEAEKVLVDMEAAGVPRNVRTFNVLVSNLCKIRATDDALKLFDRMGEWGCYPNRRTFLVLTRSLYQAARIGEGDEMIDRMKSAGCGDALNEKAYNGFLKILCGIERIDHAMSVFGKMKEDGCKPGIEVYDLLMGKLCAHGRVDKANALFKEALESGVEVTPKEYKLSPRFVKPKVVKSKTPKRETLPEKMARKRTRLRKIRLSFVKKPKKMMRG